MSAGLNPVCFPGKQELMVQDSLYQKYLQVLEPVFPELVLLAQPVEPVHSAVGQGLLPVEPDLQVLDLRQLNLPDELHFRHCQGARAP